MIFKRKGLLCLMLILVSISMVLAENKEMKIAIIKADDIRNKTKNWQRFFELSKQKNVKVSAGIICNSLSKDKKIYSKWLVEYAESGWVEFWNHGWDHKRWKDDINKKSEFHATGYEHQKKHFDDSQNVMKEILGKMPISFGTPYNAKDEDTLKIINDNKDCRLFFSYSSKGVKKIFAPMKLRGEHDGTAKPNFLKFKMDYEKKGKGLSFTAIQFHPNGFSDKHFREYEKIIDFLLTDGWVFMLPHEYVSSLDKK
jgi:peptidoglycan/xylan/chitin deacetylase (PgdA/CDA1 family)